MHSILLGKGLLTKTVENDLDAVHLGAHVVLELRQITHSLSNIRAWTEEAQPDDLYSPENINKVYEAVVKAETSLIKILTENKKWKKMKN